MTEVLRDGSDTLTGIRAPFGQVTALQENADGYLSQVQPDPAHAAYALAYHDAGGLLQSMTDPRGEVHQYEFSDNGELVRDVGPDGREVHLEDESPDTRVQEVRATVTGEGVTRYVTDFEDPNGVKKTITYPDGSTLELQHRPTGEVERIERDDAVVLTKTEPSGAYGALTPATTVTTTLPSGLTRVETRTRDVVVDPDMPETILSWTEEQTVAGDTWTTDYDVASGVRVTTSPEGRITSTTLDSVGRPLSIQRGGLAPVVMSYDSAGRPASLDLGAVGDRIIALSYYPADNPGAPERARYLQSVTGPIPTETSAFIPDAMGRTLDLQTPDGAHTLMSYDPIGAPVSLTPPDRPSHTFTYTETGHVDTYTAPAAQPGGTPPVEDHDYLSGWRRGVTTLPDGRTVTSAYDPTIEGRLISLTTSDTEYVYSYDDPGTGNGTGQLVGLTRDDDASVRTLQLAHDGPLLSSQTWSHPGEVANGSVSLVYDTAFRLKQVLVNGEVTAAYDYDDDGIVIGASVLTVTPDPVTGVLAGTALGDLADSYTWTSLVELDLHTASYQGTVYFSEDIEALARDARGRIRDVTEQITTTGGAPLDSLTRGYEYDSAGRLQYVFEDGTQVGEYVYDDNGNRLQHVRAERVVFGVYDDQDRLTQYCPQGEAGEPTPVSGLPCFTYAYNATGQLETRADVGTGEVRTFDYDELGGLRAVTSSSTDDVTYELDAVGRRVGKSVNGAPVKGWLYQDVLNPVAELDGAGNVESTFVYATMGHVPDYMIRSGQTYRIVTDHLGSVRLVVDVADGSVAQRIDYDEFGRVLADSNPGFQPFGFAGGLYDAATGLVRFGARDYDPVVGRWTAKDPILFGDGTNVYAYVNGDPINYVDPTGLGSVRNESSQYLWVRDEEGGVASVAPGETYPAADGIFNTSPGGFYGAGDDGAFRKIGDYTDVRVGETLSGELYLQPVDVGDVAADALQEAIWRELGRTPPGWLDDLTVDGFGWDNPRLACGN